MSCLVLFSIGTAFIVWSDKHITCSQNLALGDTPLTKYRKNGKSGSDYVMPEQYSSAASKSFSSTFSAVGAVAFVGAACVVAAVVYNRRKRATSEPVFVQVTLNEDV